MSMLKTYIDFLLPLIAVMSFLALVFRKPSRSAIILLFEAIIVDIYLGVVHGITSTIFGASVLLTFFCLIVFGANYYLETAFQKSPQKLSKSNLIIAAILILFFWQYIKDFLKPALNSERLYFLNLNYDSMSLIIAGFALFAIFVSSLLIFDIKNRKEGDQS